MTPANKDRATWAETALAFWLEDTDRAKIHEIDMADFLASLMHLCDARGWNFNDLVKNARLWHHFETKGGKDA